MERTKNGSGDKAKGAGASLPDERDTVIQRLERTLADERQHAALLRKTIDELRFKVAVLEKSYAKQLADARLRSGAAEQQVADQRARLASLDSDREETARELDETRAELERVAANPQQPRKPLARTAPGGQTASSAGARKNSAPPQARSAEHTINELMATSTWLSALDPDGSASGSAQARAAQEAPAEAMIAPELVFPDGYDKDDNS